LLTRAGGQFVKNTEVDRKKLFLLYFKSYYNIFFGCSLSQPLGRVARALDGADTSNPRRLKGKWLCHHGWGIICTVCGLWWMVL
jgi:hypothetical protein